MSASFVTTGTFGEGNQFVVQWSTDGNTFVSLPNTFSASPASFTVPATPSLSGFYTYRVASTKPAVVSAQPTYTLRVLDKPSARLRGHNAGDFPINPYTPVRLSIEPTGRGPYVFTLTDSTKFSYSEEYSTEALTVYPKQSTTYTLASVRNACGYGQVSGSASIKVNPVDFVLINRTSTDGTVARVCIGGTTPIYFSTTGPLPPNTRFSAQLIDPQNGNQAVAIPVSGTTSPLLLEVPASYPYSNSNPVHLLRIFSAEAGLAATQPILMTTPPRLSITATPNVVLPDGEVTLVVSASHSANQRWLLSDGSVVTQFAYNNNTVSQTALRVRPTASTSYSFVAPLQGECLSDVSYASRTAPVTVLPGIRLTGLSKTDVCAGEPLTIYYSAPAGFTMPSRVQVNLQSNLVGATVTRPGEITLTVPPSASRVSQIQVVDLARQPLSANTPMALTIKEIPRFVFGTPRITLSQPGNLELWGQLYAGGQTELTLSSGHVVHLTGGYVLGDNQGTYTRLPAIYLTQSQTFSVIAARNECGVQQELNSSFTEAIVERPTTVTGIAIRASRQEQSETPLVCPGAEFTLNVTLSGTFEPSNQFRLELINSSVNGQYVSRTESVSLTGASVRFRLPTEQASYKVRLVSTNPITQSNELSLPYLFTPPSAKVVLKLPAASSLYTQDATSLTVASGELVQVQYRFEGTSPFSYTLADGQQGQTSSNLLELPVRVTQPARFQVTRLSTGCLSSTPIDSATVRIEATQLRMGSIQGASVCAALPQQLPFIWLGQVPTAAAYQVEVSTDRGASYQAIPTTGTTSPVTYTMPTSLAGYDRQIRLVAKLTDQSMYFSLPQTITLDAPPSVTLSADGRTTLYPQDLSSSVTLKTTANPVTTPISVLSDGRMISGTGLIYVSKPGEYSLINTSNRCGYGQTFGMVRITSGPSLTRLEAEKPFICETETARVRYEAQGDFNSGNIFRVYLVERSFNRRTLLVETATPTGVLAIPPGTNRPTGTYTFTIESTSPSLTLTTGQLKVQNVLRGRLNSAAISIYPGEAIGASVWPGSSGPYSFTLSDGQSFSPDFDGTTNLSIRPTQTSTYTVVRAENSCGVGQLSGSVSVTVLPASAVRVRAGTTQILCSGQTATLWIDPTGPFESANQFTVQLSDSTGHQFQSIPTTSSPTQVTVTIPANWPSASQGHRFRVISTHPVHVGASSTYSFGIYQTASGTLTGNTTISKGESASLSVALTGTPPWQLTVTDLFGARNFTASQSPFILTVKPDTTSGYRLTSVRNSQCGLGGASGMALVTVTKLLAIEPTLPIQVRVWPNPTTTVLAVEGTLPSDELVTTSLYTLSGQLLQKAESRLVEKRLSHRLDLSQFPVGVYILTVGQGERRGQFRVVKQ
ncbi:T9SS type A sorting domain-containing protein [Fibrella aestuarina]|nr:T9SS type A sorting domain-containing protein [Fibrella aestuarina]